MAERYVECLYRDPESDEMVYSMQVGPVKIFHTIHGNGSENIEVVSVHLEDGFTMRSDHHQSIAIMDLELIDD